MRRVVTGFDGDGRSTVLSDGHAPVRWTPSTDGSGPFGLERARGEPSGVGDRSSEISELWNLDDRPQVTADDPTLGLSHFEVDVPAAHTKWIITRMGPGAGAPMHATPTIDYGLVVAGDIELGLETGSVHLEAGDAVVVNAVPHSWLAGPQGCTIATVLVGQLDDDRRHS
jgi:quercetin dioxygenase-like cupin family protein